MSTLFLQLMKLLSDIKSGELKPGTYVYPDGIELLYVGTNPASVLREIEHINVQGHIFLLD